MTTPDEDKADLRRVLDWLGEREETRDPKTCYRCWQIGHEGVAATCIVQHNVGTPNEWKCASCDDCMRRDTFGIHPKYGPTGVPPSRLLARLLPGGAA